MWFKAGRIKLQLWSNKVLVWKVCHFPGAYHVPKSQDVSCSLEANGFPSFLLSRNQNLFPSTVIQAFFQKIKASNILHGNILFNQALLGRWQGTLWFRRREDTVYAYETVLNPVCPGWTLNISVVPWNKPSYVICQSWAFKSHDLCLSVVILADPAYLALLLHLPATVPE